MAFFANRTSKFIFIFNPNELDGIQTDLIIKYMFISNTISKIVHGSDSLDIPYLFQDFFMNNNLYIYDFTKNVIDTRFLCEYSKITSNYEDKKCSIYDALLHFNVINKNKYKYLVKINKSIGSYKEGTVIWNVHNMSKDNLKYAFYQQIIESSKNQTKDLYKSYKYIILLTRLIFLDKWGITSFKNIKMDTDPLNNYIVKFQNKSGLNRELTMINIFNSVVDKIIIHLDNNSKIIIKYILEINYFKPTLITIFKKMVYSILTSNFVIYKNKKNQYNELPLTYHDIYKTLIEVNLTDLIKFIKLFYKESYIYIIKFTQNN